MHSPINPARNDRTQPDGCGRFALLAELLDRRERLSAMGEMTARLAHQVRTPLASALLYAAQLDTGTPRQKAVVEKLTKRLSELARMLDDILGFVRDAPRPTERVAVAGLLQEVADTFAAADPGAVGVLLGNPDLVVTADRESLQGALVNLVSNALEACTSAPRVELGAECRGDRVWLTVADNGTGIAPEVMPRLFEPFFTTRPKGTGLGLAIVHSVADAHGGEVLVDTGPSGSTFALCLPAGGEKQ